MTPTRWINLSPERLLCIRHYLVLCERRRRMEHHQHAGRAVWLVMMNALSQAIAALEQEIHAH